MLNQAAPVQLEVALALVEGLQQDIQFPAKVTFVAGDMEGEVEILAAMPFTVGGEIDKLKIELEN